ncbi:GNAT family N-acetyltransferase [Stackebrandtia soli]|uniref:GNAT family N-acetyltransferase n=1 Tax=Stackebrandtia soli TaxID=1892856 RepID=UPI0039ED2926
MTLNSLRDLPKRCRGCVFWELSPECGAALADQDPSLDKEAWVSSTLLQWGGCGQIAYVDNIAAGFVTYAPSYLVPRANQFPSGPASADAALLMTAHVAPAFTGLGIGRLLVQAAATDLSRRGIRALETFGDNRNEAHACVAPTDFFQAVGFTTVAADPHYPRLRLDLSAVGGWHEAAGAIDITIERWLASISPVGAGSF